MRYWIQAGTVWYLRYVDSNAVDIRRYKATKLVPLSLLAGDTRMLIHMMEEKADASMS